MSIPSERYALDLPGCVIRLAPGVAVAALVAALGFVAAPYVGRVAPIPAMVIALVIGIVLNPLAVRPAARPGMEFCVKTILRWAVALLGLRIGLADITALGPQTAILIVAAMILTIVSGLAFAQLSGQSREFGALVGVATGVCGASATLALAAVLPDYRDKQADVAFVVVAVNVLATVAMVIYPPLCLWLGLDAQATGVMLGGTIHDVAQVAGAGYAVSITAGNAAVIVKLFRVFLLLPIILAVSAAFGSSGAHPDRARVPVPTFAIMFLVLCALNSLAPLMPSVLPQFNLAKAVLVQASNWGLLLAIGALGLSTSVRQIVGLGWRHMTTVVGTTAVILVVVTAGTLMLNLD